MRINLIKYIVFLAILIFVGITLFVVWQKYYKNTNNIEGQNTVKDTAQKPELEPENKYPKIEDYKVPILMYHYVRDASGESQLGKNLSVSPDNFEAQVKWMKDEGYVSVKMADLTDPEKKVLSQIYYEKKKPIALTFDDGYEDAYTQAFPILEKYEFIGTFYIIRNYVGRAEYMNQEEIDKLEKAGNEIGSHTLSHPNLTTISNEEVRTQITQSKLESTSFCYPAGKYDDSVVAIVKDAGYKNAVTTKSGIANQNSNPFELPRVRIEDISASALASKLSSME